MSAKAVKASLEGDRAGDLERGHPFGSTYMPAPLPTHPTSLDDTKPIKYKDKLFYKLLHLNNGMRVVLVHEKSPATATEDEDDDEDDEEMEFRGHGDQHTTSDSEDTQTSSESVSDDHHGDGESEEVSEEDDNEDDGAGQKAIAGVRQAAIALAVQAGSFADSTITDSSMSFPGLAHFCEHMLFLGSERFPKENELDDFLAEHGGYSNAYTEAECTVYQIEVGPDGLLGALDRLSAVLETPLFAVDSINREVNAIHSEFQQVLSDDSTRVSAVLGNEMPEAHPCHGFGWGNKTSLLGESDADLDRREALYAALQKFVRKYYIPSRMHLCIRADFTQIDEEAAYEETFDRIEKAVKQLFQGRLRNHTHATPTIDTRVDAITALRGGSLWHCCDVLSVLQNEIPYPPQTTNKKKRQKQTFAPLATLSHAFDYIDKLPALLEATRRAEDEYVTPSVLTGKTKTVKSLSTKPPCGTIAVSSLIPHDIRRMAADALTSTADSRYSACLLSPLTAGNTLHLHFTLPEMLSSQLFFPEDLLGHLIGHEASGSILQHLKQLGLANGLSAGVSASGQDYNSSMCVFSIEIDLTQRGLEAVTAHLTSQPTLETDPIEIVFAYVVHVLCGGINMMARTTIGASTAAGPRVLLLSQRGLSVSVSDLQTLCNAIANGGPNSLEWVHAELKHLSEYRYHFGEDDSSDDVVEFVSSIASSMVFGAADAHILTHHNISAAYTPSIVALLLAHFQPECMRIAVSTTQTELFTACKEWPSISHSKREPWFGVDYTVFQPSEATVRRWREPNRVEQLHLPPRNPFIPEMDGGKVSENAIATSALQIPTCFSLQWQGEARGRLWHVSDERFFLPKACFRMRCYVHALREGVSYVKKIDNKWQAIISPETDASNTVAIPGSILNCLLLDVLIQLLQDDLNEDLYLAECADLKVEISTCSEGIDVNIEGHPSRIPLIVRTLVDWFARVEDRPVDPSVLHRIVGDLRERYINRTLDISTQAGVELAHYMVENYEGCWKTWRRGLLDALVEEEKAGKGSFARVLRDFRFRSDNTFEFIAFGQISADQACELATMWCTSLSPLPTTTAAPDSAPVVACKAMLNADLKTPSISVVDFSTSKRAEQPIFAGNVTNDDDCGGIRVTLARVPSEMPSETNVVVEVYVQTAWGTPSYISVERPVEAVKTRVLYELIANLMHEPLFHMLRTTEQLGYTVHAKSTWDAGCIGINITVQSSSHTPAHVKDRIQAFLLHFNEYLRSACHQADGDSSAVLRHASNKAGKSVRAMIRQKLAPPNSISDEFSLLWGEVHTRRYHFSRFEDEAACLESITADDGLQAAATLLRSPRLIVFVEGQSFCCAQADSKKAAATL